LRKVNLFGVRLAYLAITAGFIAGVFSYVRLGSIAIAIGMSVITLAHWESGKSGKIERYLALAIALALFTVAISLPRGL
jgi:transcriptional regulator with XRE-family HTH domain